MYSNVKNIFFKYYFIYLNVNYLNLIQTPAAVIGAALSVASSTRATTPPKKHANIEKTKYASKLYYYMKYCISLNVI